MANKQTEKEAQRAFTHGSGGAAADMAAGGAAAEHRYVDTPHAKGAVPTPEGEKHDHLAEKEACAEDRQEALLDEALEETFPSSDPISPKHIT